MAARILVRGGRDTKRILALPTKGDILLSNLASRLKLSNLPVSVVR